jgi:hypothetical protein
MRLVRSLIERLQRWIAALNYTDTRGRRRPPREFEWNDQMIGDLRRRSLDF